MRIVDAFASHGKRVVPLCIRSVEEKRPLRKYAIQVLIQIGPDASEAVPALIGTLDDSDAELRQEALFGLGAMGSAAADAVSAIAKRLADNEPDVQYAACYALGKIGPPAASALPALQQAMQASDDFLKMAATWSSLKIDPDNSALQQKAVPILIRALENEQSPIHVRIEMAALLGELGPAAKPAISALREAAADAHPDIRRAASQALESIE